MDFDRIDDILRAAISRELVPGIVFAAGDRGGMNFCQAYGKRRLLPHEEVMTVDTAFDLASLTKVAATWAAVGRLVDQQKVRPETTVGEIDPSVLDTPVGGVTIGQLLTHTGGLSERTWLIQYGRDWMQIYRGICERALDWTPGTHVAYSNRGFILLGYLAERIAGMSLDGFVQEEVWRPAGMLNTAYNPVDSGKTAPTEYDPERGQYLCGIVHDENARVLGGVAGHAGVFSDVGDLSRYCRMIVGRGEIDGRRVLSGAWIEQSFQNHTEGLNEGRGYGWQKCPGENSMYRHFGFTGTTIWIDLEREVWAVMLTNRVHPDRERYLKGIQTLRAEVQPLLLM